MKKKIQVAVSIILGIVLLVLVFQIISFKDLVQTFKSANPVYIIISAALALIAHWARAKRWTMLIEPVHAKPSVSTGFISVLVGYLVNMAIPRAGEVARCAMYQRLDKVPLEKGIGTVVIERVIDVLCLLLLIMVNFVFEFERLQMFFTQLFSDKFQGKNTLLILTAVLLILGLGFLFLIKKYDQKLSTIPWYLKLRQFVINLYQGLISIKDLKNPTGFIGLTALIWVMYYFSSYVLFFAVADAKNLGMLAGLTILVVGSIGMTAPTQGGIGAYHLLVGNVVVLYGLSQSSGIILATFLHGCQTLYSIVFGVLALLSTYFVGSIKSEKLP